MTRAGLDGGAANGAAARHQVPPPGWGSNTSRPQPAGSRLAASIKTGKLLQLGNVCDVVVCQESSSSDGCRYRLFLFDGDIFYHFLQTGFPLYFCCPSRPLYTSFGSNLMCCADHSAADAMRPGVSKGYLLGSVISPPYLLPSLASCSAPLSLSVSDAAHIHQSSTGSASLAVCFCFFSVPLGYHFLFNL